LLFFQFHLHFSWKIHYGTLFLTFVFCLTFLIMGLIIWCQIL
jgi:hypothetical protein